ncbi:hypothetical protein GCM10008949_46400 [Deinococcus humi]|nr:hypothetical protein GCM10008949_46400 [Deinococcus humi]
MPERWPQVPVGSRPSLEFFKTDAFLIVSFVRGWAPTQWLPPPQRTGEGMRDMDAVPHSLGWVNALHLPDHAGWQHRGVYLGRAGTGGA